MFGLFGGGQASKALDIANKATTGIISAVDAMVYTDEEKSSVGLKIGDAHIKLMETLANENTAKAITRRILAVTAYFVFFSLILASFGLFFFNQDAAVHAFELAKSISNIILTITIFYFGYYGIAASIGAVKSIKK